MAQSHTAVRIEIRTRKDAACQIRTGCCCRKADEIMLKSSVLLVQIMYHSFLRLSRIPEMSSGPRAMNICVPSLDKPEKLRYTPRNKGDDGEEYPRPCGTERRRSVQAFAGSAEKSPLSRGLKAERQ